jgi:Lrp/AsnC family transcriptional regulator, leucine-responsive regulatory protein
VDAVDRQIIAALRINGRATYADLGRQVGLSASAVHERVGKLESTGVITGYHAVVEPNAVGLGVTALVGIVPTDTGDNEEIAAALAELAEVESCYAVAGDEAFVVKVRVATVDELELTLGRLRRVDGVARTRTTVVLSTRFEGRPNNAEVAPEQPE